MRKNYLRFAGAAMAVAMTFTSLPFSAGSALTNVVTVNAEEVSTDKADQYGLPDKVQDGIILQCWNWSFNNIADNMEKIASLGYKSVQTSPIQTAFTNTKGKVKDKWYWLYQPLDFSIDTTGQSALGTKEEFIKMCEKAHEYGVKVIVDIIPNHLASNQCNPSDKCLPDILNDATCWHTYKTAVSNYNDRLQLTQYCSGALADLNTGSEKIQNYTVSFMKECIDAGADGFRFDSAKHMETPKDDEAYRSDFWPNVISKATDYAKETRNIDLYCYGEILGNPYTDITGYTDYISITDSGYSDSNTSFIEQQNCAMIVAMSDYTYPEEKNSGRYPVVWAESHDTYANDNGSTKDVKESVIELSWAFNASRAKGTPLYFARPQSMSTTAMGDASNTGWQDEEVGAVNRFHNYFKDAKENVSSDGKDIIFVERKNADGQTGVTVVNCKNYTADVSQKMTLMADGVYKDRITGNVFKVSGGKLTGKLGKSGIAVIYNVAEDEDVFTFNSMSKKTSGSSVVLSAKATGSDLQYKFTVKSGSKTTVIKDYSSSTQATWKPSKIGKYTLTVSVKKGDNIVSKSVTHTVSSSLKISLFKTNNKSNKSKVNKKVTMTAAKSGGSGTVKYKFTYKFGSKTTVLKNYSTAKSVSFTPKKKGTYKLTVSVMDGLGKVVTKTISYKVV